MSLPYSYINSIKLQAPGAFNKLQSIRNLDIQLKSDPMVKQYSINNDNTELLYQSLFSIQYKVEIQLDIDSKAELHYEIKLNRLIQVCIVLVIFIAFFSSFRLTGFLWFSAIFTLLFFVLNVFIINKHMQQLIKSYVNNSISNNNTEEILTKEQLEWIKDKSKCPACGEVITEYDRNCPECGLRLRENAPQKPFDVSKYPEKLVRYYYREKKKDKK